VEHDLIYFYMYFIKTLFCFSLIYQNETENNFPLFFKFFIDVMFKSKRFFQLCNLYTFKVIKVKKLLNFLGRKKLVEIPLIGFYLQNYQIIIFAWVLRLQRCYSIDNMVNICSIVRQKKVVSFLY